MSTDSDEEVGRELDYSDDDSKVNKHHKSKHSEHHHHHHREPSPPPKPKEKPKSKEPKPEKPKRQRLSNMRREQIIARFKQGAEDPEYEVSESNGTFRVSKRKSFYSPSAKIDSGQGDIHLKWMNLQTQMNEALTHDLHKLRKKYEKLSEQYEQKYEPPPQLPQQPPSQPPQQPPSQPPSQPTQQKPQQSFRQARRQKRGFLYSKGLNVRDY
jgi:hypothetical protein